MNIANARESLAKAHRNFNLLWSGQTLSLFGNQFLVIGLPLLAVQSIGASAAQAALLPFLMYAPFLLFGLPVGAMVDRLPRRKTMIIADIIQLGIYGFIGLATAQGRMTFPLLTVLVFFAGVSTVFFQVAYSSLLPEIYFESKELQKGNAKLSFSESISRTLGPIAAGPIISAFAAPVAILINAISFLASAATLGAIQQDKIQASPLTSDQKKSILMEIKAGWNFVFSHPKLEPVFFCGGVYILFFTVTETSLVLYCKDILLLTPSAIGFVIGAAAAGFPIANLLSLRLVNYFGISRTLVISAATSALGLFLIAIFGASNSITGMVLASVLHGLGDGVFGPTALTLRQTETPLSLLGRVTSVQRFMIWGAIPIGSLLTSLVIKYIGLQWTLWFGGAGTTLCLLPLIRRGILVDLLASKKETQVHEK